MPIKRIDRKENMGYYSEEKGYLTNFIFEISHIEFNKSSVSYNILVTNGTDSTEINGININKMKVRDFKSQLFKEEGMYIVFSLLSKCLLLEIFKLESNLFIDKAINQKIIQ